MRNCLDSPEDPALIKIHTDRLIIRDIEQLLGICEFTLRDGRRRLRRSRAQGLLDLVICRTIFHLSPEMAFALSITFMMRLVEF